MYRVIAIAALLALAGCSKAATGDAADGAAAAAAGADTAASSGACGLLRLGEVQRLLPAAVKAVPRTDLAAHGIDACAWHAASGKAPVLEVQTWQVSGADDTALDHARTLTMGLADPMSADAEQHARIEEIAGVGETAVAFVERTDPARGIIGTAAFLALQKNGRIATVSASDFATRERATAIEALSTLGRTIAGRM